MGVLSVIQCFKINILMDLLDDSVMTDIYFEEVGSHCAPDLASVGLSDLAWILLGGAESPAPKYHTLKYLTSSRRHPLKPVRAGPHPTDQVALAARLGLRIDPFRGAAGGFDGPAQLRSGLGKG